MKLLVIFNPNAGFGKAEKLIKPVSENFSSHNINFDFLKTEYKGHGMSVVSEADFSGYDGIISAGGDGTLFEVINGYMKNPSEKRIPIGVVPVGTGNAFIRDLGLSKEDWKKAIDIISKGKTRQIDCGRFKTNTLEKYFLNIIGLGFVSDVNKTAQSLKVFGNLSYTLGVFYQLLFLKPKKLILETNGSQVEKECIFIEVSNSKYTSNFLMAPDAELDDGELDVTILKKTGRWKLITSFPKIFTGEHVLLDEVETFRTSSLSIKTEKPEYLTPDGEMLGTSPVEIECLKQKIGVFWE